VCLPRHFRIPPVAKHKDDSFLPLFFFPSKGYHAPPPNAFNKVVKARVFFFFLPSINLRRAPFFFSYTFLQDLQNEKFFFFFFSLSLEERSLFPLATSPPSKLDSKRHHPLFPLMLHIDKTHRCAVSLLIFISFSASPGEESEDFTPPPFLPRSVTS